jgi:hypothetical protein
MVLEMTNISYVDGKVVATQSQLTASVILSLTFWTVNARNIPLLRYEAQELKLECESRGLGIHIISGDIVDIEKLVGVLLEKNIAFSLEYPHGPQ